jgi:hypothetical protein
MRLFRVSFAVRVVADEMLVLHKSRLWPVRLLEKRSDDIMVWFIGPEEKNY